jgi:hypothetical protein
MDCDISGYHVESFNYFCDEGLQKALRDIPVEKFRLATNEAVEFSYANIQLGKPSLQSCNVSFICLSLKTKFLGFSRQWWCLQCHSIRMSPKRANLSRATHRFNWSSHKRCSFLFILYGYRLCSNYASFITLSPGWTFRRTIDQCWRGTFGTWWLLCVQRWVIHCW